MDLPPYSWTSPAGIWCENDVVLRRIDVDTTSFWHLMPTGSMAWPPLEPWKYDQGRVVQAKEC